MKIKSAYKTRPVRFVELFGIDGWQIKIYSISVRSEFVDADLISAVKENLSEWLQQSTLTTLESYKIATLIVHEGNDGCFAIINWWIDENMLQLFAYFSEYGEDYNFKLISHNGIVTCVWEMAVLWFERNSWITHVLSNPGQPDIEIYLNHHFNDDV